jgi:hypothetical protein
MLFSVGFALAAVMPSQAQPDSVPPSAPIALSQDALRSATYDQRSDFTVAVRSVAAKIDDLIVPLTKRQKGGIAGGADAMTLEKLQTSRTELGHEIGKLEDVTPESWISIRDSVLEALVQTQDAYAKAAKEYNNRP